ncbi:hypothetical protein VU08_04790 [Desulfobulbus sp. F5]|nr:hypothetical protein [Desulfobulbus sp. F5]
MPDNSNNPNPPNNPPHVPTLADKQIDLSHFDLMDLNADEIRSLPKPKIEFPEAARQVIGLYPDFSDKLQLTAEEFDPDKVAEQLSLADQLIPYAEWLERRAEQVRETRMFHLADAYRAVLRVYHRAEAAEAFDPQVGYAFAFLDDYFGIGKKKSKKE